MIVAAHQPNFLPWLGFFDKARRADIFILVDHVQFERQNFQNRTRIHSDEGPRWLVVPVRQRSRDERILEKEISDDRSGKFAWNRKAALAIRQSYARAPHFKDLGPAIEEILARPWRLLLDLNLALLEFAFRTLDIKTKLVRSSTLSVSGAKSELVLDMCRAVGATKYLAGMGGSREYLDRAAFQAAGVEIEWQGFEHPVYPQAHLATSFAPGLSVLDLVFNCGPEAARVLAGAGR